MRKFTRTIEVKEDDQQLLLIVKGKKIIFMTEFYEGEILKLKHELKSPEEAMFFMHECVDQVMAGDILANIKHKHQ